MKNKIYFIVSALLTVPAIAEAGIFPDGKKFEFIAIVSFLLVALGAIFIYYLVWKSKQSQEGLKKDRYVIRSVQVTSNGRTYVKSKKIKVQEEPKKPKKQARPIQSRPRARR